MTWQHWLNIAGGTLFTCWFFKGAQSMRTILIFLTIAGTSHAAEYQTMTKAKRHVPGVRLEFWERPVLYDLDPGEKLGPNALNRDELRLFYAIRDNNRPELRPLQDLMRHGYRHLEFNAYTPKNRGYSYSWQQSPTKLPAVWIPVWWSMLRKERANQIVREMKSRKAYRSKLKSDLLGPATVPQRVLDREKRFDAAVQADDAWIKDKPGRLPGPMPSEVQVVPLAEPGF